MDWNKALCRMTGNLRSHTLRGCVDWNFEVNDKAVMGWGHTLRGCVDWNKNNTNLSGTAGGHTLRGCVDWNWEACAGYIMDVVTPCVGVYGLKHCSLVGQVYGRIVSIRPLVYFSSSCYKIKSQTKYVRLLTLLWLEKTRTIPDAYLLSVFFCGFT